MLGKPGRNPFGESLPPALRWPMSRLASVDDVVVVKECGIRARPTKRSLVVPSPHQRLALLDFHGGTLPGPCN